MRAPLTVLLQFTPHLLTCKGHTRHSPRCLHRACRHTPTPTISGSRPALPTPSSSSSNSRLPRRRNCSSPHPRGPWGRRRPALPWGRHRPALPSSSQVHTPWKLELTPPAPSCVHTRAAAGAFAHNVIWPAEREQYCAPLAPADHLPRCPPFVPCPVYGPPHSPARLQVLCCQAWKLIRTTKPKKRRSGQVHMHFLSVTLTPSCLSLCAAAAGACGGCKLPGHQHAPTQELTGLLCCFPALPCVWFLSLLVPHCRRCAAEHDLLRLLIRPAPCPQKAAHVCLACKCPCLCPPKAIEWPGQCCPVHR